MSNNIFQFLDKNRIKSVTLIGDTITYLSDTYKQSIDTFTYSTAFGQITLVVHNLFQLVLFYIQDSIGELNFATMKRNTSIYGMARLQGHSAMRGTSARGEITMRLKEGFESTIGGNFIYIPNLTRLRNLSNNLTYMIDLGADDITIDITNPQNARVRIVEGTDDVQIFTGTGKDLQTYEANTLPGKLIEDHFIIVSINGERVPIYDSLTDIPFGHRGCLVKTGMTSGIDIIFGNAINTNIPKLGEQIRVDYIYTSGSAGNIRDKLSTVFEFEGSGFDTNGEEVNLNDFFNIQIELAPEFGADAEPPELTRILAPNISRNFIIHDEKSISYFLGRMNYFSVIKVFKEFTDNNNNFNVLLLPNVKNRLNQSEDYFSVDINKLTMTDEEETRLVNSIDESGRKSANVVIRPIKPNLKNFSMYLILEVFEKHQGFVVRKEQVNKDVRDVISDYMLENRRINKVPHSDIVRILDEIPYMDTVKVIFAPQNQEDVDTKGNISVGEKDMVVMRGGFTDTDGVVYEDSFNPEGQTMGAVNLEITFVKNIV